MLNRFITPGGAHPQQQAYMVPQPHTQTMYPVQPTYHPSGLVKYSPQGQPCQGPQYQYQRPQGQYQVQGHLYPPLQGAPYPAQGSHTMQGVPPHVQGVHHTMQGVSQHMPSVPQSMQGVTQHIQSIQVSPQGIPHGSGPNVNHPPPGSGYNMQGAHGPPSSIYSASWASEPRTIQSPPQNIQSPTSATQVSSQGLQQLPTHMKEPRSSFHASSHKQPSSQMQERSTVLNPGSASQASSNYQTKLINIDIKSAYSQVSESESTVSSASSSPRKSSLISLARTMEDQTTFRACSPPIAPHPFATRNPYEASQSEDVGKTFESRASIHGITISAPGTEKPSKEPSSKTQAPKKVYQQKVKADRFMEIALKRGITVSSGSSIVSDESSSEAPRTGDNSCVNSVADADELLPLSESDVENCDIRSYFSDSCSQSDSESYLIDFSNQFAKVIIEKACAELAKEARKKMLDVCEDEESVSMDSEVQEYFDAPVVSNSVQACEPLCENSIESTRDDHSDSPLNLLYVNTDQPSSLNAAACEFVSQSQQTSNEPKGLSLNPESPEFKPSFFRQNKAPPTEETDPAIALYKKNSSSGVDVYIGDQVDKEEFADAQDDLEDAKHPSLDSRPFKEVLMVDASVNTRRVKQKDVEQQTPLAFEPRDVSVNTDEVCMVEGSEFFTPEILQRTAGTNTTPPETKHRGIQARLSVETKNCGVQVGSDDFKPTPWKDVLIVELQMQLCHLRAQICISELQRQKNELKRSKFQINTFFYPGEDTEDHLTAMLNARIGWLENEISQTKVKLMNGLEALQAGLPLDSIPTFGITIPTSAAGDIVYRPKELKLIRDENNPQPLDETQEKYVMEGDLQRERKILDSMDSINLSNCEDRSSRASLNEEAIGNPSRLSTSPQDALILPKIRTSSTDLLKHSLIGSPQKSSSCPLERSLAEMQSLQSMSTDIETDRKQIDSSDSVSSIIAEPNIKSMSFGERLSYFESKSKSLDTSENTCTQDASKITSNELSSSEKPDQLTPENNPLSVQKTVNESIKTEAEQHSLETLSESPREGKLEIVSSKSITDSSSFSLFPSESSPRISITSTPSPLKPLSLPLPSKPSPINLKQEETCLKSSATMSEMPEEDKDCVAPPGFKALEKIPESGNNLDLATDEIVQKAQSVLKNFTKMKQTPSKQPNSTSSPSKPLSSQTKPSTVTEAVISPTSLASKTSVEVGRSEDRNDSATNQTCQSDDGNTGISQLILSARKKLRESKILDDQFERSLSNSPCESNSDQSTKAASQDVLEKQTTPVKLCETDKSESKSTNLSAASDSQPQPQAAAKSQDLVLGSITQHQPQASAEPSHSEKSTTLLPTLPTSEEMTRQQVEVPPQTLQAPQPVISTQQQVGVAQPQPPTPQINPQLYQTVLAQVAKAYPHLTANPMMLHSVCLQQTMVLQAYMKNSQNPGAGATVPPGHPQGPPQGLHAPNSLGQAPAPVQGPSTGLQGQSQGPSKSSQRFCIDSTSGIKSAANTALAPITANQRAAMSEPSVTSGQAQKPVLQPLRVSNHNQSDLSSSIVGAGDSQKSAFQSVKPNQTSYHDGKALNASDHMMQMRKGTGDAGLKAHPPSTFTFHASAGPITITGKAGNTENIPPTLTKNKKTKSEMEIPFETSTANPFDQTSGFTKVTYQKKRPTTRGKTSKTTVPEEIFPKVKAKQVPTDEDWEGQCESYPEEFTCKQDAKAPVYFTPIEPPARSPDDFAFPKPPKASEEDQKPRGRGRRRNNSSRCSTRSNTPSDDSPSNSRRNSYLGLDDFGSDLETKPTNVDTNFLGRLLKHTVKSNDRLDQKKEERRANKTPDPEKKQEQAEEDWQTVSQKKRKRDQVRADQLPSMAVVPAQTSKTQKGSTRNNFEKLVDHLEKTFPFLSRQELKDLIQTIRYQRGGGLTGMKMNDIVDAARLIIQQQLKAKLVEVKKPTPVPQPSKSVYCTPEFQKHLEATKSYLPAKSVVRSPGADSSDEDVCPICFENFSVNKKQRLDCGHEFHVDCIREWVMKHERTCPTCRRLTLFQEEFPRLK